MQVRGNIPPNPKLQGHDVQKRLARQTQEWLAKNDAKRIKKERFLATKRQERDQRQAQQNTALLGDRQKALGLRPKVRAR